jgi:ATP-dependent DNA helicase PIF1
VLPIDRKLWELDGYKGVFRSQIQLRLAWACTIHKAQGATLDSALIDIGSNTFEYGQAYVALSRVKGLESLYIHDFTPTAFRINEKVSGFYKSLH